VWSPRTMWSLEWLSEYEFWIYKDQTSFALTPNFLPSNNMSAPAKSTSPIAPTTHESKDWTKASTLELQSGSEDEASILDAKVKERHCRKQVRREEKQQWEEAERLVRKEAECKVREEAEHKVQEEVEHKAHEQAEKERVELEQRKAAEVAAKQRAV